VNKKKGNKKPELKIVMCTMKIVPCLILIQASVLASAEITTGGAPEEVEAAEEIVNGCGYKLYSNRAIFPFPSLAKDAIHWQQGMDVRECKKSCREGRPVAGCKSIVFNKKGRDEGKGCWLLPEDKTTYERRREYYASSVYDFYQLQCESNQGEVADGTLMNKLVEHLNETRVEMRRTKVEMRRRAARVQSKLKAVEAVNTKLSALIQEIAIIQESAIEKQIRCEASSFFMDRKSEMSPTYQFSAPFRKNPSLVIGLSGHGEKAVWLDVKSVNNVEFTVSVHHIMTDKLTGLTGGGIPTWSIFLRVNWMACGV